MKRVFCGIVGILILWTAMLLLLGCATALTPEAAKIQEADEEMVKSCKFLGSMTGKSSLGIALPETGEANAKADLLKKAAVKGVTHVIWKEVWFSGWGWRVNARTYKCP
jgi:hypothetical protein